jgi:hypothetical protein
LFGDKLLRTHRVCISPDFFRVRPVVDHLEGKQFTRTNYETFPALN